MIGYEQKLARVLDVMGGLYLVDDLKTAIAEDKMQGFVIGNSWAVTQVTQFPRAKRLQIVAAVGDMGDMVALHDRILEYASDINVGPAFDARPARMASRGSFREHGWRLKAKNYLYQRNM